MSACPDCGGSIGQLTATKCGRCSERDALKAEVSRLTDALANVSNRADAACEDTAIADAELEAVTKERDEWKSDAIAQRSEVARLEACLGTCRASLTEGDAKLEAAEKEHDGEMLRWQDAIRDLVIAESHAPDEKIDGGGCESGDPLDSTLAEIRLGFAHVWDCCAANSATLSAQAEAIDALRDLAQDSELCPSCSSGGVVCCALCGDRGYVPADIVDKFHDLGITGSCDRVAEQKAMRREWLARPERVRAALAAIEEANK